MLLCVSKKEKTCFFLAEIFYYILGKFVCFEYPTGIAGNFLQIQKGLDKKCVVIQEGEIFCLAIFPRVMEMVIAFIFKMRQQKSHVDNRQVAILFPSRCCKCFA